MAKPNFKNRPNKCIISDGHEYWISRSNGLVAVVFANFNKELYVLIGKRGTGAADFHGKWNLPCGYIDWDENGYDGMIREVYEETGLHLPDIPKEDVFSLDQPFFVNTDPTENRQNISLSYGFYFNCKELPELTSENSEPDEVEELKWMKLVDLLEHDFAFGHERRIIMYKQMLHMYLSPVPEQLQK